MNEQTNWVPGLAVLAIGAATALFFLVTSKKKREVVTPKSMDDLQARYQTVLEQLKSHVSQKHAMSAQAFETEKKNLESQAAGLLRQMKDAREQKHEAEKAEARAEKAAAVQGASGGGSTMKGVLIGAIAVGVAVFLGSKLSENTSARGEGQSITGGVPRGMGGGGMPQQEQVSPEQQQLDAEFEALFQAVQAQPDNANALADISLFLMRHQDFDEAKPFVHRLATVDPFDVRGRVLREALTAVDGKSATALPELERLAGLYPEAYDARLLAGMMAMDQRDKDRAMKNFDLYLQQAPPSEVPPGIKEAIEQARSMPLPAPGVPSGTP
jgi:hypothetical protein